MTTSTRSRSVLIDAALAAHGTPMIYDERASVHPCQGAKFHSPSPLITRRYCETGMDLGELWLCPTCTKNLVCFLHLFNSELQMDWPLLREFGNSIRELGMRIVAMREESAPVSTGR